MKSIIYGVFASLLVSTSFAAETDLFVFKKSYNPGNVLHYAVNMDADCKLAPVAGSNYVKPYWVMGEERGQIEGLTSKEARVYTPVMKSINAQKDMIVFEVAAISEVEDYIPNPEVRVETSKNASGKCVAVGKMVIDSRDIILKEVYTNGKFTITFSWKTNYMTITGLNMDGSAFTKKIVP